MDCKYCSWLLPLIVIVFTFWTQTWSKWVVLIAALLMLWQGMDGSCVPQGKKPKKKK